jgi:hypothetical protein
MPIDKSLEGLFNQDDFDVGPEGFVVVEEEEAHGRFCRWYPGHMEYQGRIGYQPSD